MPKRSFHLVLDKKRPAVTENVPPQPKKITPAYTSYCNRVKMFIQLFRNQFLDNIRTVSTERFFVIIIVSYYLQLIQQLIKRCRRKKPFSQKGLKAFSFHPKFFYLFQRLILCFRTNGDDEQEAENVDYGEDPERIGEAESADRHRDELSDRPVRSP